MVLLDLDDKAVTEAAARLGPAASGLRLDVSAEHDVTRAFEADFGVVRVRCEVPRRAPVHERVVEVECGRRAVEAAERVVQYDVRQPHLCVVAQEL